MATLAALRRQRLMRQKDLAEKAGVAPSTIHLIETGKTRPRLAIMQRICEALNVKANTVDEFKRAIEQH